MHLYYKKMKGKKKKKWRFHAIQIYKKYSKKKVGTLTYTPTIFKSVRFEQTDNGANKESMYMNPIE